MMVTEKADMKKQSYIGNTEQLPVVKKEKAAVDKKKKRKSQNCLTQRNDEFLSYIKKYSDKREKNLKYDFMPELQEIIEKPAHIGGKVIIWGITAFVFAFILWSACAKTDVVVTATGVINPKGNITYITCKEPGIISEVMVSNGDYVNEGDELIKEDTSSIDTEIEALNVEIERLKFENSVYEQITEGVNIEDINIEDINIESIVVSNEEKTEEMTEKLVEETTEEITEEITSNFDLKLSYNKESFLNYVKQEYKYYGSMTEQYKTTILSRIIENNTSLRELELQLDELQRTKDNMTLKASESGVIAGLSSNIIGISLEIGSTVMEIVPKYSEYEMECYVKNSDISDIKEGMDAIIKIDAYPYSDYGVVEGKVTYVSATSFMQDNLGYVYTVKVELNKDTVKNLNMTAGMSGTAEFKKGKRSVLRYFLDPIMEGVKNSVREE